MMSRQILHKYLGFVLLLLLFLTMFLPAVLTMDRHMGIMPEHDLMGGNAIRGRQLISDYGCASCHRIPGIPEADAVVGPPLASLDNQTYIAGTLTNTTEHLVEWIRFPQQINPGSAMPDMGVTRADAVDIAAYLYSLE